MNIHFVLFKWGSSWGQTYLNFNVVIFSKIYARAYSLGKYFVFISRWFWWNIKFLWFFIIKSIFLVIIIVVTIFFSIIVAIIWPTSIATSTTTSTTSTSTTTTSTATWFIIIVTIFIITVTLSAAPSTSIIPTVPLFVRIGFIIIFVCISVGVYLLPNNLSFFLKLAKKKYG